MAGTVWGRRKLRIHHALSSSAARAGAAVSYLNQTPDDCLTLDKLEQWYLLGGSCQKCHHVGWLDRWDIGRRFGKRVIIVTLMPKLRCTTCGNTRGNTLKLGKIKR
jgi:hypothetical protein